MTLNVDPQEILLASQQLSDMADVYKSTVGKVKSVDGKDDALFETGEVSSPWSGLLDTMWSYFAATQDNLNDTSRTLVRYLNAVCADDENAAKQLDQDIDGYNDGAFDTLDVDGNDKIDADERTDGGYTEKEFNSLDKDGDGSISKEEYEADTTTKNKPLPGRGDDGKISEPSYEKADQPKGDK